MWMSVCAAEQRADWINLLPPDREGANPGELLPTAMPSFGRSVLLMCDGVTEIVILSCCVYLLGK